MRNIQQPTPNVQLPTSNGQSPSALGVERWTLAVGRSLVLQIGWVLSLIILISPCLSSGQTTPEKSGLNVWQVDSMEKIFKDATPPSKPATPLPIDAARNEVVSGQIVVWCEEPMENMQCQSSPFTLDKSREIPAPRIRYPGYVPVGNKKPGYMIRPRPCDYPDPLYDLSPQALPPKTAQPIWLTLTIPSNAPPGLYRANVEVSATVKGTRHQTSLPISVQVYPVVLPDKRTLKVSNWPWFDSLVVTKWCGVDELYSEPYWKLMEEVARNMAAHRQNVILTPITAWTWKSEEVSSARDLVVGKVGKNGGLEFDFTLFDRWVTIFRNAGVDGLIESGPLAKFPPKDKKAYVSIVWTIENGKPIRNAVHSDSPEYEKYLSVFLPALQAHLQQQGWLDHYVQHILDEPNGERRPTYIQVAKCVKKYAPRIRIIDATQTTNLVGSIDIWVPTFRRMSSQWEFFKERQAKGEELWFYTMNRSVEYPLTRVRLLQWANYGSKTTGYLHWGYNWWVRTKDPCEGRWTLSPGDEWIVYPKKGGVWDSIRYESMLEGIQDYELLKLFSARNSKAADTICEKLVRVSRRSADERSELSCEFDDSIDALRAARRELLKALSGQSK